MTSTTTNAPKGLAKSTIAQTDLASQVTRTEKLLAIPGPVELSPTVQATLALPPLSHVAPEFVKIMQEALALTRQVARTSTAQAFILAGSGTLGWEQVAANLIKQGDRALVLETGYFGVGFRECLEAYGAQVDVVKAKLGETAKAEEAAKAVRGKGYKMVTITHVDTSTGVLADVKSIAAAVKRVSPDTLVVVDAVCSLASEELEMDAWDLDVVFSASQKGLGAPPGLSILLASPRAMMVWEETSLSTAGKAKGGFYASWKKWTPIMKAYDSGNPAYFGTPAVTLVRAYHASLMEIVRGGVDERIAAHRRISERVGRTVVERLGFRHVAVEDQGRAHGMTAVYVPDGVNPADVLRETAKRGVVMAGGLVAEIKDRYIRIGHMGWGVVAEDGRMVDSVLSALSAATASARGSAVRL